MAKSLIVLKTDTFFFVFSITNVLTLFVVSKVTTQQTLYLT